MDKQDSEFLAHLMATFKVEAKEQIDTIAAGIIDLERESGAGSAQSTLEAVFRAAHSLKGAARSVNFRTVERVCHEMEDVFARWKRAEVVPTMETFDALHSALDHLHREIFGPDAAGEAPKESTDEVLRRFAGMQPSGLEERRDSAAEAPVVDDTRRESRTGGLIVDPATVRISAMRLETLLAETEELLEPKLAAAVRAEQLLRLSTEMRALRRQWEMGETSDRERLVALDYELRMMAETSHRDSRKLSERVDSVIEHMKRALVLPFASLLNPLPKIARDLARSQGKEVDVRVEGEEIEVDRRILDEMRDPLIHLIRNCIDHGIEVPDERERLGKRRRGEIAVTVSQLDGGHVSICISDDGAGIDVDAVKGAALKAGMVTQQEVQDMPAGEALLLALRSGLSTSPLITDVSGRGLGLSIAQERVGRLGSAIQISSERGRGTTFRMRLPVAVATARGVLARVGDSVLVFPALGVERVVRVEPGAIQTVESCETIRVDGKAVSLARLQAVLGLPAPRAHEHNGFTPAAVLVQYAGQRIAFLADEIVGEQEVMIKGLGKQLLRVRNVAGTAVLGSGKVVPLLDIKDLVASAVRLAAAPAVQPEPSKRRTAPGRILVAEDSITARALLKSILESAGFEVRTAVDGAEALALARTEDIDVIVSDVEMPRMNGFELTAKIRSDKRLADLPVVLVTALESREDRERGIEAGANAYIVKSSFEQSNLLEVVQRWL